MTFAMAEGLVNAINAYLAANISAKLTALNTEYADSITLLAPTATYKGPKSLTTIPEYPVLYIISTTQSLRPWQVSGTSAVSENKPRVYVGIVVLDSVWENLHLRLYRYARAIVELLLDAQGAFSLDNWNLGTDEEWEVDTETTPFETDTRGSQFLGEVSVAFRANKVETK